RALRRRAGTEIGKPAAAVAGITVPAADVRCRCILARLCVAALRLPDAAEIRWRDRQCIVRPHRGGGRERGRPVLPNAGSIAPADIAARRASFSATACDE